MSGARGEGAIIDRDARRVRLRHEPDGFAYQLRRVDDADEERTLEVVRVDGVTGEEQVYGYLRNIGGRWRPDSAGDRAKVDAVSLVARAWNQAPLLRRRA